MTKPDFLISRQKFHPHHLLIETKSRAGRPIIIDAHSGDWISLRGKNGAGKTTLIRALAGQTAQTETPWVKRSFNHHTIEHKDPEYLKNIHWLNHLLGLGQTLNIFEEWSFWYKIFLQPPPSPEQAQQLANYLLLEGPLNRKVARLSAGEQQKVALARLWMVARPIWLLDEPDHHLDHNSRELLLDAMKQHCKNGGIIIESSHQNTPIPSTKILLD